MQPPGYVHSLALLEAAEYCKSQIIKNGFEAILSKNRFLHQGINIVFGAHINPELLLELPNNLIIFNTEQLAENSVWTKEDYKKLLASRFVWDYSDSNLKFIPHQNKSLISFYDDDSLRRIKNCDEKEWDLCFYGSLNERRNKLIFDLESKGLKVNTIFGVYGPERDHIISRSKAVLNLHFYDSQVLQVQDSNLGLVSTKCDNVAINSQLRSPFRKILLSTPMTSLNLFCTQENYCQSAYQLHSYKKCN
jgi:hypothetical protein